VCASGRNRANPPFHALFHALERRARVRHAKGSKGDDPVNNPAKLAAALVLSLPLTAAAAEALPKPVADMQCLVGQWKGGGSMVMGKDAAKISVSWTCRRSAAQFGVSCSFRATGIPGVASYEATDLMGYEPNSNTYHWYTVTNAGETHDHVAQLASGPLQFVFNGTQEGKPLKEVIELNFSSDSKRVSGRAETFVAGASVSVMQLELHK
jgi:hypothetical protein